MKNPPRDLTNQAGPSIKQKPVYSLAARITIPAAVLALLVAVICERSAYYTEILSKGHRIPYSDQLLLAGGVLFLIIASFFVWLPGRCQAIYRLRHRLSWLRWLVSILMALGAAWLFVYSEYSLRFDGFFTRLLIYSAAAFLTVFFASNSLDKPLDWSSSLAGLLVFGCIFVLVNACQSVVDYPFRLSWSEGNRFYDYSVLFGRRLYDYPQDLQISAYIDKGRQFLWGLPFLFSDISIWSMRLWNQFLFTIPYFLLGLLFLHRRDTGPGIPFLFGIWTMLLLNNGPIYTPLILTCILVILTRRSPHWLAIPVVFIASYFARQSRFTWMFAPGMWAVLLAFLDSRQTTNWTRWIRSIALGISGILGGYVLQPAIKGLLSSGSLNVNAGNINVSGVTEMVGSQQLLWDRLLPSGTFALGVVPALLLTTAPAVIFIVYALIKRRWKLDRWQILYLTAMSAAFLVVGLIVSVKIGGGSNLHNLDMFLISIVLITGLMLENCGKDWLLKPAHLPHWAQFLLLVAIIYPATLNMFTVEKLVLPEDAVVEKGLKVTQTIVQEYKNKGEVLFMDQRQLLTFGYVQDVPLVSEYEKKLVMENALQDNEEYFNKFYQDLIEQRFSLIISEPLYTSFQKEKEQFGSENNAWVKWVSIPMLCYYKPELTFNELGIQFLVPRENAPAQNGLTCPPYQEQAK